MPHVSFSCSPEVKGCFILRPWAYKLWEQIQAWEFRIRKKRGRCLGDSLIHAFDFFCLSLQSLLALFAEIFFAEILVRILGADELHTQGHAGWQQWCLDTELFVFAPRAVDGGQWDDAMGIFAILQGWFDKQIKVMGVSRINLGSLFWLSCWECSPKKAFQAFLQ